MSEVRPRSLPVDYSDLDEDLQRTIAELEVKVQDLEYESNFYRGAVVMSFCLVVERVWNAVFT